MSYSDTRKWEEWPNQPLTAPWRYAAITGMGWKATPVAIRDAAFQEVPHLLSTFREPLRASMSRMCAS